MSIVHSVDIEERRVPVSHAVAIKEKRECLLCMQ